jgi:hypothetical protein
MTDESLCFHGRDRAGVSYSPNKSEVSDPHCGGPSRASRVLVATEAAGARSRQTDDVRSVGLTVISEREFQETILLALMCIFSTDVHRLFCETRDSQACRGPAFSP